MTRRARFVGGATSAMAIALCGLVGVAAPALGNQGELALRLAAGSRGFDHLSFSDARPLMRGEDLGRLELKYGASEKWSLVLAGQYGGSFYDFVGLGIAGSVKDVSWTSGAAIERVVPVGEEARLFVALGFEYGESRSWLKDNAFSEDGPRNIFLGGTASMGAAIPLWKALSITAEVSSVSYRAHAGRSLQIAHSAWLGHSLGVNAGLEYALRRPKRE
jgi:hypothetical protein